MSLDYARDQFAGAVRSLATSEAALHPRLQAAWTEHVGTVWEKPCLTVGLCEAGEGTRLATLADLA